MSTATQRQEPTGQRRASRWTKIGRGVRGHIEAALTAFSLAALVRHLGVTWHGVLEPMVGLWDITVRPVMSWVTRLVTVPLSWLGIDLGVPIWMRDYVAGAVLSVALTMLSTGIARLRRALTMRSSGHGAGARSSVVRGLLVPRKLPIRPSATRRATGTTVKAALYVVAWPIIVVSAFVIAVLVACYRLTAGPDLHDRRGYTYGDYLLPLSCVVAPILELGLLLAVNAWAL